MNKLEVKNLEKIGKKIGEKIIENTEKKEKMEKEKVDFCQNQHLKDNHNVKWQERYIKDYSVRIARVQKENKLYIVIVDLHRNLVTIVQQFSKETVLGFEVIDNGTLEGKHRELVLQQNIFDPKTNKYENYGNYPMQRKPHKYPADFLYYSLNDNWSYINLNNNDPLDPMQVCGIVVKDFEKKIP